MTPGQGEKPTYSKGQVNRAGRAVAERMGIAAEGLGDVSSLDPLDPARVVEWWRREHAPALSRVALGLRSYTDAYGRPVVAQRLKRATAIAAKLRREATMKLTQMADIGGVRTVLPNQVAAYEVAARLRKDWTITKFRDYVADPKPDGYRALHLINCSRGWLIEVQLRTPDQDAWANLVDDLSRTAAPGLKFGGGPPALRRYLALSAEVMGLLTELAVDDPLAERLREFKAEADTLAERAIHGS